jgi:transcriptional regulator with XRE-family HTH domain
VKDTTQQHLARSVGAAIAMTRTQAGLTQDDVAEALQIGPEAVSRMERGVVLPSLVRLVEFADLFKCPVEHFFNKSTGLTNDNATAIAALIEPLKRTDRQFVLDLLERTCAHLSNKPIKK